MDSPKILLISPLPPPVGGIASWTVNILDFIRRKEKNYELIHLNSAIKSKRITDTRVISRIINGTQDFITQYKTVVNLLKKNKPTVVHITSSASLALFKDYLFARLFKRKGIRSVIHFRFGRICELKEKQNWEWFLLKIVMRSYDEVIVLDLQSYKCLFSSGIKNIHLVPNPISNNLLKAVNNIKSDKKRDKGVILFVGHIIESKGVYELVKAVSDLKAVKELRLIGPYEIYVKNELIKLANTEENKIKFINPQPIEQIIEEMASCEIFVLPSYTEGFPNVILEAMVTACPIISTNVGAIPDMLKENAGICIPAKDTDALTKSIKKLIDYPEQAELMGKNAKKFALENYQMGHIVNRLEYIWFDDRII